MSRISRPQQRGIPLLFIASIGLIIASGALFVSELIQFAQQDDRISGGIAIAGVSVGNLREFDAINRIEEVYTSPITLYYNDAPINLDPNSLGYEVDTATMIAAARGVAEIESGFWGRFINYLLGREEVDRTEVSLSADYQDNILRSQLEEIAEIYDQPISTSEFDLETLTVSVEATGYVLDIDAAVVAVDAALGRAENRFVELPVRENQAATGNLNVLREMLLAYLDEQGFIYDGQESVAGIFVLDLTTGQEITIQGDVAFSAASTNKVSIMIDLYRNLEREPNQDEAFLMANSLLCSNNSSSNRIMNIFLGNGNIFAGVASVTNTAQYIGARNTFLTAPLLEGSGSQQLGSIQAPDTQPNPNFNTYPDTFNQTTAEDMGNMFSMIYDCATYGSGLITAYPGGEFTQHECRQMIELMSANDLNRLLQAGVPEGVRIAHKNGWLPGQLAGAQGATTGDAGIIFSPNGRDYVLSVYLWEDTDGTGFDRWPLIEEISRATWNYFNPESPLLARRNDLPPLAQECLTRDSSGVITSYNYLPPYGEVDLDNINGWRDGSPTTPQPLPGEN